MDLELPHALAGTLADVFADVPPRASAGVPRGHRRARRRRGPFSGTPAANDPAAPNLSSDGLDHEAETRVRVGSELVPLRQVTDAMRDRMSPEEYVAFYNAAAAYYDACAHRVRLQLEPDNHMQM